MVNFTLPGGRKFAMTLAVIAIGLAADAFAPKGLSDNLLQLLLISSGLFGASNVVSKFAAGNTSVETSATAAAHEQDAEASSRMSAIENALTVVEAEVAVARQNTKTAEERLDAIEEAGTQIMDITTNLGKSVVAIQSCGRPLFLGRLFAVILVPGFIVPLLVKLLF